MHILRPEEIIFVSVKRVNWILIVILCIGAALRFCGFPHIPFMYDELSAWGRTGYNYFSDLIKQGVRGDGHPALIQVFLNYWRQIFGDSEASFKLPFIIMGISCIWLVYVIGKNWFNETVGILSATFIAVLQYTVMYSQIARPYISGLFFSLLMVHYWSKYVFVREDPFGAPEENRNRKFLYAFTFFAALCCYNHYFSLLFAIIIGLSGFFFLPKKNLSDYSLAGVAVLLLFLPHFGITMDQFSIGGVGGWLAKPDGKFFGNYLSYVFDFSWWVKGLVIVLVVLSFIFIAKDLRQKNKLRLLCLVWFLAPLLIGYLYSKYKNPVLQYSVLIFSFPFLLLFLFSFFRDLKKWQQSILVTVILAVGIYSLIFERMHYRIFYKQPVEQMVQYSVAFAKDHPDKRILIMIQEPEKYMGYYLKKWNSNLKILSWNELNFQSYIEARKFITSQNPDYVLCGNIPYDQVVMIKDSYPKLIEAEKGFTYEFFSCSKEDSREGKVNDLNFSDTLNFIQPGKFWHPDISLMRVDSSSGRNYCHFDSSHEFGCSFEAQLQSIMQHRDDILLADVAVANVTKDKSAALVVSFDQGGKTLLYQEKPFSFFIDSGETSGHLVYALRFRDFDFTLGNPLVKIYLWNKNHQSFDITSMKVEIEKGNPLIYSLIEAIPHYYAP